MKTFLNKPGVSLLIVGAVLAFIVRPLVGGIWIVGGVLSPVAFILGAFFMVGGIYLVLRSNFGKG